MRLDSLAKLNLLCMWKSYYSYDSQGDQSPLLETYCGIYFYKDTEGETEQISRQGET